MIVIFAILFAFLGVEVWAAPEYKIVKCCGDSEAPSELSGLWLVFRKMYRKVPDEDTATALGFPVDKVEIVRSSYFSALKRRNQPVRHIKSVPQNPDEGIDAYIASIRALEGDKPLIKECIQFCPSPCRNPAIVNWNNHYIAFASFLNESPNLLQSFVVPFRDSDTEFHGLSATPQKTFNPQDPSSVIEGVDPRLFFTDSTASQHSELTIVYERTSAPDHMTMATVGFDPAGGSQSPLSVLQRVEAVIPDQPRYGDASERDWVPFTPKPQPPSKSSASSSTGPSPAPFTRYMNMSFVQSLKPFHVFSPTPSYDARIMFGRSVSREHPIWNSVWTYGVPLGGSNVLALDADRLLMFFSSIAAVPHGVHTYFVGALTFSSLAPHKIIAVSSFPLVHEIFYDGAWSSGFSSTHIDYKVIPTSIVPISKPEGPPTEYALVIGHNDRQAFMCPIDLDEVLAAMVPLP